MRPGLSGYLAQSPCPGCHRDVVIKQKSRAQVITPGESIPKKGAPGQGSMRKRSGEDEPRAECLFSTRPARSGDCVSDRQTLRASATESPCSRRKAEPELVSTCRRRIQTGSELSNAVPFNSRLPEGSKGPVSVCV